MEISVKCYCIMGLLVAVYGVGAYADECGPESSLPLEAMKLFPCMLVANDKDADVPSGCCDVVSGLVKKPTCLCTVMLMAKGWGVNPEIALTIPKRCSIVDRPLGYKCGDYTLP